VLALAAAVTAIVVTYGPGHLTTSAQGPGPCAPPTSNSIVCENQLAGNPETEWDIVGAGDPSIQGFTTDISVNRGQTVSFKITTDATNYRLDIYRLGYYGGLGARKVATVLPSVPLPQEQPDCVTDLGTGLVDCGTWTVSASWSVPSTATSGIYVAKAVRTDTGGASHIVFIVRRDNSASDILLQADDTTWQAYNGYGGNSLYLGSPAGRAYKVSYNRPFNNRAELSGYGQTNWVFWGLYPKLRWLEANGYDVTYISGVDSHRFPAQLLGHKVFMTVGHDEYWSGPQRTNVEAALSSGVNMAFFSGNFLYWKIRYEPSIDGSSAAYRTLVCYKETLDGAKIDPSPEWTGTWRDPQFSPPSNGGRPENALTGTIFGVNRGPDGLAGTPIEVPAAEGKARLWRNTSVATLGPGQVAVLSDNTLGYEWDEDVDNGFRPGGLIRLSSTTEAVPEKLLQGYGAYGDFGPGTATHALTLYRHSSGALVFSAATVQWSWGLDAKHDGAPSAPDARIRQATVNLLADMSVQPITLQSDLVVAAPSQDVTRPTATITYPSNGLQVPPGAPQTITGTASDAGGGIVAGVEVSANGGQTWHPAVGRESWTYTWTPQAPGTAQIRVRAVDDSANIQAPAASVTVTVATDTQPPQVSGTAPGFGATNVSGGTSVTATFNEVMTASTLTTATFLLTTPASQVVPATVTYNASTRTATLQPSSTLAFSTTYTARVRGGSSGVKDFSGNAMTSDVVWSFTTWAAPPCPCSLWDPATAAPSVIDSGDGNAYELGVKFRAEYDGTIMGLRFYKSASNTGIHTGHLWRTDGTLLGSLTFTSETSSGWQEAYFSTPVAITANTVYVASYHAPNGHYSLSSQYFGAGALNNSPLRAAGNAETPNGVFKPGASGFPNQSFNAANYWVDAIYLTVGGDTTAPTVTQLAPASGATGVSAGTTVTATFNEAMSASSITGSTFEVRNASGQLVAANVTYSSPTRTATLQSSATFAFSSSYTARVRSGPTGVKDVAGNPLAADQVWTFTTGGPPACPCSLWDPALATPVVIDSGDTNPYELGVRFSAALDGYITGIRYYKSAANVGLHTVNLWSNTGTLLGTSQVDNGAAVGWQEVTFAAPVAIAAHTTYVASYHAPGGHYSFDAGYFAANGVTRSPLSAPSAAIAGNGVFKAGASGFPNLSYNAANYWVDVAYVSVGGDTTPPTVTTRSPGSGATGVSTAANVTATFSEAMDATSIASATMELRNASNQLVGAALSYNAAARTAMLNPTASLAFGTTYTARVRGGATGVKDAFGNPLAADVTWTFTTGAAPQCPCTLWPTSATPGIIDSGDAGAYELGVKFRPEIDGVITGIRFYKGAANSGTHVGSLWTSAGVLLMSATFTGESATGWQEVTFTSPVAVAAGATYVASYWAPNGHYSINGGYFSAGGVASSPLQALGNVESPNGVYRAGSTGFPTGSWNAANYWVDVVFMSAGGDTTPPTITSRAPASGATGVPTAASVTATFNELMDASTISGVTIELRDASSQLVGAAVSYNAALRTATLDPTASLASSATYTARVRGGASGVKDVSGNPLVSDVTWTFTTGAAPPCPCTIWPGAATPGTIDSGDGNAYELGVKFRPELDGVITGIRFFKSAANTGTHVANLWTSSGALLASATFGSETASGWQTVTFATPVPVTAGTVYVASYWAPNGHYSINGGDLVGGLASWPLSVLASTESPNGVYRAGSSGFPTGSWNASNYWVDVVFMPQ
jgi:hypothetical protein